MSSYQIIGLIFALTGIITASMLASEYRQKKSFNLTDLPKTSLFIWVVRLLVGGLFLYSGFVKANDYIGFGYKLEEYFFIFGMDFLVPAAELLAAIISVFEIGLGVALILGFRMPLTAWLSLLMMIFFTFLTGFSAITGSVTDCGCFGDALKITPWESFTKDIILTVMLLPLFLVRKSVPPFPNAALAGALTLAALLISGGYAYYCHENLPVIDFRAYKVGTDLNLCTTQPGPEGIPLCKDWEIYYDLGEPEAEAFAGTTLMVVMYDMEKARPEELSASVQLANSLQGTGIQVIGVCSNSTEQAENFIRAYNIPYTLGFMDNTVLKTIVRSNPGYMLLKEGVIVDKWHHNQTPTSAEIQAKL